MEIPSWRQSVNLRSLWVAILEGMRAYSLNDVHATRKRRDSWWTVFLVDPVACRLTLLIANHTDVTPNGLTRKTTANDIFVLMVAFACSSA